MRSLPAPRVSAETSYRTSIRRVADANLKQRLKSIVHEVVAASDGLATAAAAGTVAAIQPAVAVGSVTSAELKAVYKHRFARLGAPGRIFYDELITSPPNGKCPLCAHRDVATLDHFLPQSAHPALIVAPLNLVPACSDCNKAKLAHTPSSAETVTLFPYFDKIDDQQWLVAAVEQTSPASVHFWVAPPGWPEELADRVAHHFKIFGLAELYAVQAAEELLNIRRDLQRVFEAEGEPGVSSHLRDMATSREDAHMNSWQTATYKAFAESTWFCDGGFAAS